MKHCCEELANKLGKGNSYPIPAYISPADWEHSGHLDWWYSGADGPGYYFIHTLDETIDLSTPDGMITVNAIEYRRMEECPYCSDKKSRSVGRPPTRRKLKPIHVSLYPSQIEYLGEIGKGNISRGARRIIEEHRKS